MTKFWLPVPTIFTLQTFPGSTFCKKRNRDTQDEMRDIRITAASTNRPC